MKQQLNEVKRMQQLAGILTEATTYMTIKDELTSAMEAMGYKKESDDDEDEPAPMRYEKLMDENRELVAEVSPFGKLIGPGADFGKFSKDYSVILVGMYIRVTAEEEEKKFFGMIKKKIDTSSMKTVIRTTSLDLSKNTTEEAVDKITRLFKQGEAKAKTL
jgi:hypothetical protein